MLAIGVHYGFAFDLDPVGLAWGAALAAGAGSGLWSTLLLGAVLAALAGVVRVLFARRRIARDAPADGRVDQDARAAQLRRTGLARRHRIGAAPMKTASRSRLRSALRALSTALIVSGTLLLADAGATLLWQEPVSAVYSQLQQGDLQDKLATLDRAKPTPGRAARARAACPIRAGGWRSRPARSIAARTTATRSGSC